MCMEVEKAIILAGGLGTRFLPQTKTMPKAMLPILDKPIIQLIVEQLADAGIKEIIIIIRQGKEVIKEHFERDLRLERLLQKFNKYDSLEIVKRIGKLPAIKFIYQCEDKYGNAVAIAQAREYLQDGPFMVLWEDAFYKSDPPMAYQLIEAFRKIKKPLICVMKDKSRFDKSAYIKAHRLGDSFYRVQDIIEKPGKNNMPSDLFAGTGYILMPDIFPILSNLPKNKKGEYTLSNALKVFALGNNLVAFEIENAKYIDVGDKAGYLDAILEYAMNDEVLRTQIMDQVVDYEAGKE